MQQKRSIALVFLIVPLLWALEGCSGVSTPGPENPEKKRHDGLTLRVVCPDETTRTIVAETSRGWAGRAGVRAVEVTVQAGQAPDDRADVWALPASQMPHWAAQGKLEPLPAALTAARGELDWYGLLPHYREQLLKWDGTAYAAPLLGDAPVCFYRKDLLADASLKPPATWDAYANIAEHFLKARGPEKAGPSLPPLPAADRELDWLFCTMAASIARRSVGSDVVAATDEDLFAFHFDPETGQPRIAGPGFVRTLRLMQRLQACRPPRPAAEPWKSFRAGQAVLCLGDARLLGEFQARGSKVRGHVGVCLVPGNQGYVSSRDGKLQPVAGGVNRVVYLGAGAVVLAVPRGASQKEAAFELVADLAGRSTADQIVLDPRWGGGATRSAQLDAHWDGWRLDQAHALHLRSVLRQTLQPNLRNPLLCLRVPEEHRLSAALAGAVRAALVEGKAGTDDEARAVLEAVAKRWTEIIGDSAREHTRSYRRSLGIQGDGP